MTKIIVYDQLPGTGKSTQMISRINNSPPEDRWIVVVPFLSECHRYAGTIADIESGEKQLPKLDDKGNVIYTGTGCSESGRQLHHPKSSHITKVEHISRLVREGKDIVTTHAALKLFTPETVKDIRDIGYNLLIDEELEAIRPHNVKSYRRRMLLDSGVVYEDENGLLRWNPDYDIEDDIREMDDNGFSWDMQIKALCDNGSLILIPDSKGDRDLFMWEYPIDFLKSFEEINILTYMFEGSIFEKYLKVYGLDYTIQKGIILPDNPYSLIDIVDNPKMNRIGDSMTSFSATDQRRYSKSSASCKIVKDNLYNYFVNGTYCKSKMDERLWTCLLDAHSVFKGSGYTKRYIPHNTKAVNDYCNTSHLAYVYNSFLHPEVYKYLQSKGDEFTPDADRYSLTELIQWLYRSRLRKTEPITLYIPSGRMRNLLTDWMSGGIT